MRAQVGRADLLAALVDGGDEALHRVARTARWDESSDAQLDLDLPQALRDQLDPAEGHVEQPLERPPPSSRRAVEQIPWTLQVSRRLRTRDDDEPVDPPELTWSDLAPKTADPPTHLAVPWRDLEARIARLVAEPDRQTSVDVRSWTRAIVRCRPIAAVRSPRRSRWPRQLRLVLDRSVDLAPVEADQRAVRRRLERRYGRHGLQVEHVQNGGLCYTNGRRVAPGAPSLVLTGWADGEDSERLAQHARRETEHGLMGRAIAVIAAGRMGEGPPRLPPEMKLDAWDPLDRHAAGDEAVPAEWALAHIASVLAFVEPGLLRDLRSLPACRAGGLAAELNVWASHAYPHAVGAVHDPSVRQRLLTELTRALASPDGLARAKGDARDAARRHDELLASMPNVIEHVSRWRSAAWAPVGAEDIVTIDACFPEGVSPVPAERIEAARLLVEQIPTIADPELLREVRRYFDDLRERAHPAVLFGDRYAFLTRRVDDLDGVDAPEVVRHQLVQRGKRLEARPAEPIDGTVGEILCRRPVVGLGDDSVVRVGADLPAAAEERSVMWTTDTEIAVFERFGIATRLSAMFAKDGVLWAEVGEPAERMRFAWRPPAEPIIDKVTEGVFEVDSSTFPRWASGAGIDEFGAWADVEVEGVSQRMRWVPPGAFLMGSSEEDAESFEDERAQHRVELTAGFWLAETPCTQDFYEAVTGARPSRFEGARRPVENVSWEDARQMMRWLDELVPGFGARLPTEAEWEYACRAGTTQPRYREDLDEIAWYYGNSDGSTHDVAQKAANPWGFHDMLGNVDEWCADWQAGYPDSAVVDPTGPQSGDLRVLRGGSWWDVARYCRAAYRFGLRPDDRFGYFGFRLSRGQRFQSGAQPSAAEPEAGRDARRRRGRRGTTGGDA